MMFTREQIEAAHQKVRSGADFPRYVSEIKRIGVKSHEVVLLDGMWIFKGAKDEVVQFQSSMEAVEVSIQSSAETFKSILKMHQNGETDFSTFCKEAGFAGIERWISDFAQMTVTYFGTTGEEILIESIPVG